MKRRSCIVVSAGVLAVLVLLFPWTLVGKMPDGNRIRKYVADAPIKQPEYSEWTFSADRVVGEHNSEYVEAFGNCSLSLGKDQLRADFVRYYQSTGWVFLKGNIRAHWGGDFLQAEEAEFDLNTKTGWLKRGKVFMAKPHIYVEAERVGKAVGDTYTFKNAKVTSCSGERPAWSVTSQEGEVSLDGRVHLYHSAFRIKDVPVFYWPYMALPGANKRQSGFLIPYIATSDKLGFQVNLPYYWAINDESDATFYQNYMSKRGYMQGIEYRHANDSATKGVWQLDAMYDRTRASAESKEWRSYRGDGLTRNNPDRWWVRSKYNGWLGSPKWLVKLDLDVVSDQNYLRDFENGPSGYEASREQFLDAFGRDINNADSLHRLSTAYISRSWDRFGVTGLAQYDQALAFRNGNAPSSKDPSVQKFPELDGFAWQQSLFGTGLEASLGTKYNYFHREHGNSGHRLRVTPELKLPLKSSLGTIIPAVSLDHTSYNLTSHEKTGSMSVTGSGGRNRTINTDVMEDGFQSRTAWSAGFTAFSEMTRVFNLADELPVEPGLAGTSRWTRLKHSVVPRVEYGYSPHVGNQHKLPYFDTLDRLDARNKVTYSLTNVLDRRRDTVVLSPGEKGGQPVTTLASDYLDFILFRLEQSYDLREADRRDQLQRYGRRPFSDLLVELKVKPEKYINLLTRNWFSPYTKSLTQSESAIVLHKDGLGMVSVGYDFQDKVDEYLRTRSNRMSILNLGAKWEVTEDFSIDARYRHDFVSDRDLERTLKLNWAAECYSLYFSFTQKPNDNRFELGFDLLNF